MAVPIAPGSNVLDGTAVFAAVAAGEHVGSQGARKQRAQHMAAGSAHEHERGQKGEEHGGGLDSRRQPEARRAHAEEVETPARQGQPRHFERQDKPWGHGRHGMPEAGGATSGPSAPSSPVNSVAPGSVPDADKAPKAPLLERIREGELAPAWVRKGIDALPVDFSQQLVIVGSVIVIAFLTIIMLYPACQSFYRATRMRDADLVRLERLESSNALMSARIKALQTREGIEDEARSRFGLVLPGETLVTVANTPSSQGTSTVNQSGASSSWLTSLLDQVFVVKLPADDTVGTTRQKIVEPGQTSVGGGSTQQQVTVAQEQAQGSGEDLSPAATDAATTTEAPEAGTATSKADSTSGASGDGVSSKPLSDEAAVMAMAAARTETDDTAGTGLGLTEPEYVEEEVFDGPGEYYLNEETGEWEFKTYASLSQG